MKKGLQVAEYAIRNTGKFKQYSSICWFVRGISKMYL